MIKLNDVWVAILWAVFVTLVLMLPVIILATLDLL